jgi:hypothetical protein
MPSLAFAKLSLGPPILIVTSTTTQLVLNIIYFINPIKRNFIWFKDLFASLFYKVFSYKD